jgi:hypothetical protein
MKTILNACGRRIVVPFTMTKHTKALASFAKRHYRLRQDEIAFGKKVAKLLTRLEKKKDIDCLMAVGTIMSEVGLFSSRFFFEAVYRIQHSKS